MGRDIDGKISFLMFRISFDLMSCSQDERIYLLFFISEIMIYSLADEIGEDSFQQREFLHEFVSFRDEDISGKEDFIFFL